MYLYDYFLIACTADQMFVNETECCEFYWVIIHDNDSLQHCVCVSENSVHAGFIWVRCVWCDRFFSSSSLSLVDYRPWQPTPQRRLHQRSAGGVRQHLRDSLQLSEKGKSTRTPSGRLQQTAVGFGGERGRSGGERLHSSLWPLLLRSGQQQGLLAGAVPWQKPPRRGVGGGTSLPFLSQTQRSSHPESLLPRRHAAEVFGLRQDASGLPRLPGEQTGVLPSVSGRIQSGLQGAGTGNAVPGLRPQRAGELSRGRLGIRRAPQRRLWQETQVIVRQSDESPAGHSAALQVGFRPSGARSAVRDGRV